MLSVGAVSAVNWDTKTFDNAFSIKVPSGFDFKEQPTDDGTGFNNLNVSFKMYVDEKNQIGLMYNDIPLISNDSVDWFYHNMFVSMNPDLDSCYETQNGNLKFLKPIQQSPTNMALAGFNQGNKTIMVFGTDYDLVYDMGKTIKFI